MKVERVATLSSSPGGRGDRFPSQCQKDKKVTEEREKWCQAESMEIQAEVKKRHRKETDEKVCQEKVYKREKLCYSIKEADDALG